MKKVLTFAALSRPTVARVGTKAAKIFQKFFEKDLEGTKKFLPLQPASATEPFIDIMKTSSKPNFKVWKRER